MCTVRLPVSCAHGLEMSYCENIIFSIINIIIICINIIIICINIIIIGLCLTFFSPMMDLFFEENTSLKLRKKSVV